MTVLAPDLIVEAALLRLAIEESMAELCADYQAEGQLPPRVHAYYLRLGRAHGRAEARLQRREFAELNAGQCGVFGCVDTCADCDPRGCDDCGIGHDIQKCPAIRKELFA